MNCLEFRKKLLADPRAPTSDLRAHRDLCPECTVFAGRIERMEQALTEAVLIEPPEGLAARILLRRSLVDGPSVRAPPRRHFLALAASVATASIGLGAFLMWRRGEEVDSAVARELVAHLLGAHPPGLGAQVRRVPEADVVGLLARAGFGTRGSLGEVANGWPCEFRQQPIAHFLMAANPVTALVLPFDFVRRAQLFFGAGISGILAPCAHGTLALLTAFTGGREVDLEPLVERFQSAIISA
ncbi:MAG: DUF3379 family protein [Gammaproteobacteria bacterium]|nr:DUF3379 family protein [Gammaproteobacteria bacterium]